MLVKKSNGKWRMCFDYTNLNQACRKDYYPMPIIDKLIEAASGNERLSLLDAYSGYHQVPMASEDEEKTSFYVGDEIYCYVMMPFDLKNAGTTYQQMVKDHIADVEETFNNLRKNRIRLNPAKCIFGVESKKFLGFIISRLLGGVSRVAVFHRFVSKSADKCLPFFKIMRSAAQKDKSGKQKKFEWSSECQAAFDELKIYLSSPPLLTKAVDREILYLYLVELGEFEITFQHRSAMRAQALADFVVECTFDQPAQKVQPVTWILYVDGASNNKGAGAEAVLVGLDDYRSEHALKFEINFVEVLDEPSFQKSRVMQISTDPSTPSWTNPIVSFLHDGSVPDDKQEETRLRKKVSRPYEAEYALREVHEGVCGSHVGARTLAYKVLKQGDYWSNMHKDATDFVQRYGIPNQIVADNGTQFNCSTFRDFYSSYGIKLQFTLVYHPESNGMVESVNKAILEGIKPRLEQHKARWADELNNVLWACRTTSRSATGVLSLKVTHFNEGRNG
ncbi:hypothetical protein SLEP1_g7753 [Rubroshorea leprosula]|uniref:Integrase catalytic domain-containing protein n=1 Tax=Rubroshorea leprosula TaxID=152421 RepID=A0AAV5I5N6_9ROSI|nr:hypothetical protein SLEP1_g7753 [Rubroshorea leprosula]